MYMYDMNICGLNAGMLGHKTIKHRNQSTALPYNVRYDMNVACLSELYMSYRIHCRIKYRIHYRIDCRINCRINYRIYYSIDCRMEGSISLDKDGTVLKINLTEDLILTVHKFECQLA